MQQLLWKEYNQITMPLDVILESLVMICLMYNIGHCFCKKRDPASVTQPPTRIDLVKEAMSLSSCLTYLLPTMAALYLNSWLYVMDQFVFPKSLNFEVLAPSTLNCGFIW